VAFVTVYASIAIVQFSALKDYFVYTAEYASGSFSIRLLLQFLLAAYLYFVFAALCYEIVVNRVPAATVSATSLIRVVDRACRIVVLVAPTFAFAFLFIEAALLTPSEAWLMWIAVAVLIVSAVGQMLLAVVPLTLTKEKRVASSREQKNRISDRLRQKWSFLLISSSSVLVLYVWLWVDVIGAANFVGGFGVIILFLVCLLLCVAVFGSLSRRGRGVAIVVALGIALSHLGNVFQPEFTHTLVPL
jgi:hypothetical protein